MQDLRAQQQTTWFLTLFLMLLAVPAFADDAPQLRITGNASDAVNRNIRPLVHSAQGKKALAKSGVRQRINAAEKVSQACRRRWLRVLQAKRVCNTLARERCRQCSRTREQTRTARRCLPAITFQVEKATAASRSRQRSAMRLKTRRERA